MEAILQNYGPWILFGGLMFFMMRRGGCCGGHGKHNGHGGHGGQMNNGRHDGQGSPLADGEQISDDKKQEAKKDCCH